mgnify:CR=1 FL=1
MVRQHAELTTVTILTLQYSTSTGIALKLYTVAHLITETMEP